jgi:hypothetical protein
MDAHPKPSATSHPSIIRPLASPRAPTGGGHVLKMITLSIGLVPLATIVYLDLSFQLG